MRAGALGILSKIARRALCTAAAACASGVLLHSWGACGGNESPPRGPPPRAPATTGTAFDAAVCDLPECCQQPRCCRIVREYRHWLLKVHLNQGYLGRMLLICKRDSALDLADATDAERDELFSILRTLRRALLARSSPFSADWMNYAFLGNDFRHLHAQIVPRYQHPRTFCGIEFSDPLWGQHYKSFPYAGGKELTEKVRMALVAAIAAAEAADAVE